MAELKHKRVLSLWILTVFLLFVASIIMGILMRLTQGNAMKMDVSGFFETMTVHGATMIGIWFVAGMASVHYLLHRYVRVTTWINLFAMVFTVIGVVMLWCAAFIGKFHAGWTFLYPLPLFVAWKHWATPVFLSALGVLSVGWLVWSVGMLVAIFKKYTLQQAFGWQYFKKVHQVDTPPFILITVVTLIGIVACLLTALLLLGLFFSEIASGNKLVHDALLMKNLTYFFGHTVANEILYLCLATLYELLPEVSGRPKWKNSWYIALAWNATMIFILFAFFHHMYMDFVQPEAMQVIGQLASYFASLPAVAVTLFSVLAFVFKNSIRWTTTNLLFFLGTMGWIIGGVGAVIDSTISANVFLHNSLWVPAHFHTYLAMGSVLMSLAFFNWVVFDFYNQSEPEKISRLQIILLLIGGFGFLLMFYLGGAYSIPRRFNVYPSQLSIGSALALAAAAFAVVYLIAIILINIRIVKRCLKIFSSASS